MFHVVKGMRSGLLSKSCEASEIRQANSFRASSKKRSSCEEWLVPLGISCEMSRLTESNHEEHYPLSRDRNHAKAQPEKWSSQRWALNFEGAVSSQIKCSAALTDCSCEVVFEQLQATHPSGEVGFTLLHVVGTTKGTQRWSSQTFCLRSGLREIRTWSVPRLGRQDERWSSHAFEDS